jgi:L-aspartate oxidase
VQTDIDGRTTIEGLFAAGEVACTGVHGANRLASNSLLEGLVFGARAGRAMRDDCLKRSTVQKSPDGKVQSSDVGNLEHRSFGTPELSTQIQSLMWRDVGLFRDGPGIERALQVLEPASRELDGRIRNHEPLDGDAWRAASLVTVGRLIARAALRREESRGGHFRSDFPDRDDVHWKRRISEVAVDGGADERGG